jgi:hypothetical protein
MADEAKLYTSRRQAIVESLAEALKVIDGTTDYNTDLANNVHSRMLFWDEVEEYPAVHITAGTEVRQYQGGGYKDRFLTVTIRCYVQSEDSVNELEGLLADIEFVVENNSRLAYQDRLGVPRTTHDILIMSIDTDEGVLNPLGVGEIQLRVHY